MTFTIPNSAKAVIIAAFALVFHFNSFGQTDFRPGYYITWENDTIQGLIDYRSETLNSRYCSFKTNESGTPKKLYPNDILAYRFENDKFYISKKIETHIGEQQVFTEFLVNGIVNLYFFRDPNNYIYLIEGEDGKLTELKNETVLLDSNGSTRFERENNKHVGILKATFADCPEIQPKLEDASLNHKSLINITKEYHELVCEDETCMVYEKQLPPIRLQIAPFIGIGFSGFGYKEAFYENFQFDNSTKPNFGILLDAVFPRISNNLSFQLEAEYQKFEFYSYHEDNTGYIDKSYEVSLFSNSIKSSLGVKYTYPKGKIRPSITAGGIFTFLLDPDSEVLLTRKHLEGDQTSEIEKLPVATSLYGAYIQLGCNFRVFENREIFTHIKYQKSSSENWGSNEIFHSTLQFSLGIFLNQLK